MSETRATYRAQIGSASGTTKLPPVSEEAWLAQVIELAHLYGWRVFHPLPCRTVKGWRTATQGDPGWPDLVLCRPPRLIVVELKSDRGTNSPEQDAWAALLTRCQELEFYEYWRPRDFDAVNLVLARGSDED